MSVVEWLGKGSVVGTVGRSLRHSSCCFLKIGVLKNFCCICSIFFNFNFYLYKQIGEKNYISLYTMHFVFYMIMRDIGHLE